jgi:hypothetical protein
MIFGQSVLPPTFEVPPPAIHQPATQEERKVYVVDGIQIQEEVRPQINIPAYNTPESVTCAHCGKLRDVVKHRPIKDSSGRWFCCRRCIGDNRLILHR